MINKTKISSNTTKAAADKGEHTLIYYTLYNHHRKNGKTLRQFPLPAAPLPKARLVETYLNSLAKQNADDAISTGEVRWWQMQIQFISINITIIVFGADLQSTLTFGGRPFLRAPSRLVGYGLRSEIV